MTWSEIKRAVEAAGVNEEDKISSIECLTFDGDKSFHVMRFNRSIKLIENYLDNAWIKDASGCTA
jgi:hypothetical protein